MENIALAGSKNVRDLGGIAVDGGTVRDRLLLRGGSLFACTQRDMAILRDEYGLSLVVDLRSSTERNEKPDAAISGTENMHLPLFEGSALGITRERASIPWGQLAEVVPDLNDVYRLMVSDDCRENLALAIRTIMNATVQERTVLFHCSEGKDRTGLVAAILLSMLGSPREAVMADYLFTNTVNQRKASRYYWIARVLHSGKATSEKLRAVFLARAQYLEVAFDVIDEEWGGMVPFAKQGLDIDSTLLEAFRRRAIVQATTT